MAATGGHGAQQFCYTYAGRRSLKFPASALLPCCTRSNSSMRYVHTAHCGVPHTPSRNKCAPAFQLDKKRAHCFAIPFPKTAIPAFALPPFPSHHLLDSPPLASSCLREPPPHLTPPRLALLCSPHTCNALSPALPLLPRSARRNRRAPLLLQGEASHSPPPCAAPPPTTQNARRELFCFFMPNTCKPAPHLLLFDQPF